MERGREKKSAEGLLRHLRRITKNIISIFAYKHIQSGRRHMRDRNPKTRLVLTKGTATITHKNLIDLRRIRDLTFTNARSVNISTKKPKLKPNLI